MGKEKLFFLKKILFIVEKIEDQKFQIIVHGGGGGGGYDANNPGVRDFK